MQNLDKSIKALRIRSQNELEPLLKAMQQGNESLLQEERKTKKAQEKLQQKHKEIALAITRTKEQYAKTDG